MNIETLRRRIVALHLRRARLCEAYGLWAGVRLTRRQKWKLGAIARMITRAGERVKRLESEK